MRRVERPKEDDRILAARAFLKSLYNEGDVGGWLKQGLIPDPELGGVGGFEANFLYINLGDLHQPTGKDPAPHYDDRPPLPFPTKMTHYLWRLDTKTVKCLPADVFHMKAEIMEGVEKSKQLWDGLSSLTKEKLLHDVTAILESMYSDFDWIPSDWDPTVKQRMIITWHLEGK